MIHYLSGGNMSYGIHCSGVHGFVDEDAHIVGLEVLQM